MPIRPDIRAVIDAATAAFPRLGTEILDADEARAVLAARPAPPVDPIPLARVRDRAVPGPSGGPDVPVRIYRPTPDDRPLPIVIFCHGGGFVICGLDSHDQYCRALARDTGAVVVSVDYRLAPRHRYPAACDDAYAVLCWAAGHADEFGGDGGRIAVAGDSAGGNLAAALTLRARDTAGPAIAAQLLVYPMLDSRRDTASYRDNAQGYFVTADHLRWYWEQYLPDDAAAADPYACPARARDLAGLPPAHVVTAEFDPLRDEGEDYARRLAEAGVPVRLRRYDGMFHGFATMPIVPEAAQANAEACAVLRAALHPGGER
jgi:acetyl esterase